MDLLRAHLKSFFFLATEKLNKHAPLLGRAPAPPSQTYARLPPVGERARREPHYVAVERVGEGRVVVGGLRWHHGGC